MDSGSEQMESQTLEFRCTYERGFGELVERQLSSSDVRKWHLAQHKTSCLTARTRRGRHTTVLPTKIMYKFTPYNGIMYVPGDKETSSQGTLQGSRGKGSRLSDWSELLSKEIDHLTLARTRGLVASSAASSFRVDTTIIN